MPSSLTSTTVTTSAFNGQGRFGQLMGYCTNICSLASEYHHRLYTPIHKHLMQLSHWAEGQVAASSGVRTGIVHCRCYLQGRATCIRPSSSSR